MIASGVRLCVLKYLFFPSLAVAIFAATAAGEILPSNVLVLYNTDSSQGREIAQYYAGIHPGVQLLGLTGVQDDEDISADQYLAPGGLRQQVLAQLTPSIDVIVTTKGLPLRINVDPHNNPGSYTDPFGTQRVAFPSSWKKFSSLESELTRIDTISTWEQMGDQTWWLPKGSDGSIHHARNPYYQAGAAFDHETYGIRLATRLDGFSARDVEDALDRAQKAFLGPDDAPYGPVHFVLDDDPSAQGGHPVDLLESLRDNVLVPRGLPHQYDGTDEAIVDAPGPVIGYVSHGTNDGAGGLDTGYINDQLKFELADGAIFHTWESFNAFTFDPDAKQKQGLVAEWLARGGTAGLGHVKEPLASPSTVANEDQLFKMLLDGFTFAEAAWSATQQLSFVNTVVGDPLMVFRRFEPGDVNLNGIIDGRDLQLIQSSGSFNNSEGRPYAWSQGNNDRDDDVDSHDIQNILATNLFGTGPYAANPTDPGVPADGVADLVIHADGTAVLDTNGLAINGFILKSLGGNFTGAATLPFAFFTTNTENEASVGFATPPVNGLVDLGQLYQPGSLPIRFSDLDFTYTVDQTAGLFDGNCIGCVPEPSSLVLAALGLLSLLVCVRAGSHVRPFA